MEIALILSATLNIFLFAWITSTDRKIKRTRIRNLIRELNKTEND